MSDHDWAATRAKAEAVLADIVAYIDEQATAVPSRPVVNVAKGDNLGSLLAAGLPDTIYKLAPDYLYAGDLNITKPCTLTHAAFGQLPRGRVSLADPGPLILGQVTTHAAVAGCGVRFEGTLKDRAVWDAQPGSAGSALERCVVQAGVTGSRRGIALTGGGDDFIIRRSHVGNHWFAGSETQAIGAVHGAHRVLIEDCFLEASGENIMLGGDDIGRESAMCTDWQILDSHLFKPLAWRTNGATVKNLFEVKAAKRVTLRGCTLERNWVNAQSGFGIVLTVRNQYGRDPFVTVQDVVIDQCLLKGVAAGIQILGRDDTVTNGVLHPSVRMERVAITKLDIEDLSSATWGGNGRTISISGGPKDLTFDGITVTKGAGRLPVSSAILFDQPQFLTEGLIVRNAVFEEGEYGIHSSEGLGKAALDRYAPGYLWQAVTMIEGGERYIAYPAGTTKLPMTPRL